MTQPTYLLPLSGCTPPDLARLAQQYRHLFTPEIDGQNRPFYAICRKLALVGDPFQQRVAIAANTREEFAKRLEDFSQGRLGRGMATGHSSEGSDRVVFVCSGQGSQWAGMGMSLFAQEPVFRSSIEECEAWIRRYAGWSLIDQLSASDAHSKLALAEYAQPAIFAIEIALARLWESWGVKPAAVIGHSAGEVAAAYLAGALTLEDAVRVVVYSGQSLRYAASGGGMAMVHAAPAVVMNDLAGYRGSVSIAAVNSPESIVISGEAGAVAALTAAWRKRGIGCVAMPMGHAFHTPAMESVSKALTERLGPLAARPQVIPIFSTVLGRQSGGELFDATYWGNNLRQPVLFDAAVESALAMGFRTFLEVSPHPVLLASIEERSRLSGKPAHLISSLRRRQDERFAMLLSLGKAFTIGCSVDWQALYPPEERRFQDSLPANSAEESSVHPDSMIDLLCDQVREVFGLEPSSRIDETQSLFEFGFDSLLAVEFRNRLSELLDVPLDATLLFEYPTIVSLADRLKKRNGAVQAASLPDDLFLEELRGMPDEEALELLEAELKL